MEPSEAYEYAASWGSFLSSGDPGACMYGFNSDCRPQSEEHRREFISYMGSCRLKVTQHPENFDDDELDKLDAFVEFISKRNIHGQTDGSFIIEISLCGSVTCCATDGEELKGELLSDMCDCNRSGDAEPACQYILDNYKPEFRIVLRVGDDYQNVIASKEEKAQVCREIYGGSDTDFTDEDNANMYLVWTAAFALETIGGAN